MEDAYEKYGRDNALPVFMTPCFAAPQHWCIHAVRLENRPLLLGKTTAEDIAKAFGHAAEFDASDSAPPSVCYRSERVFPTFSFQPGGRPMRLREVSISVLPPAQRSADCCRALPQNALLRLDGKAIGMIVENNENTDSPIREKAQSRVVAKSGRFDCHYWSQSAYMGDRLIFLAVGMMEND